MTGWRKRQVLEMAERSSLSKQDWWKDDDALEAFAALVREDALAQPAPVQEPVAWLLYKSNHKESFWLDKGDAYNLELTPEHRWEPLYTTPPAAQPEERNFCPRCGKRTRDLTTIHTCTPPQENT
jgi:hypothetical protein